VDDDLVSQNSPNDVIRALASIARKPRGVMISTV